MSDTRRLWGLFVSNAAFTTQIGQLLRQAYLLSDAQVDVVLRDQASNSDLRFGEILALRGWLKPTTVEFFVEEWPRIGNMHRKPLGQYFKAAGLLDDPQIEMLLSEQKHTGLRLGALAALKGWMKPETVNFFLESLVPEAERRSHFTEIGIVESVHAEIPTLELSEEDDIHWLG
ncbi:MAG: hypothetical protein AAFX40_05485 [Cyanobacteria bacterium J06639_1]